MKVTIFSGLILFTLGCSSLSKEQCSNIDWYKTGVEDANRGYTIPRLENYQSQCLEHGVKVKEESYLSGFEEGLKTYCTPSKGKNRGYFGKSRHQRCEKISIDFKTAYDEEYRKFERRTAKQQLKEQLIFQGGGETCTFDSDCKTEGECASNECVESGDSCSFDSDCGVRTECESRSGTTSFGDVVDVNVCSQ